jgi:site-specific recombinase XerD
MSIASKQIFVANIKKELSNVLTVDQMTTVIDTVSEHLGKFDMERIADTTVDFEADELLNEFLSAKEIEGKSPNTIEAYRYLITRAFKEIDVPIREIMAANLRKYLSDMRSSGKADSTIASVRSTLCSFFGWVYREGLLPTDPSANLSPIKVHKKIKVPFSGSDIERLKEKCECSRDKAIIGFLYSTGCRISEVCGLNRSDVDFANKKCVVLGKGGKERTVYFDDVAAMLLSRYLKSRVDDEEALFIGKGSTRLTPGGIRNMLKALSEKAGVSNVHPHRFRRTFATNLVNHGMSIEEVAHILGHEKIDTTMKYIYIDQKNVQSSYNKRAS